MNEKSFFIIKGLLNFAPETYRLACGITMI